MRSSALRSLRRWLGFALVAALGLALAAALSQWQFDRREQALARLELVERNWSAPALPLAALLPDPAALDPAAQWHPVLAEGEYLAEEQLLVRGRTREARVGFELLTPLRLDDGTAVLVDRGWVPAGSDPTQPTALPAPPTGRVQLTARLRSGEPALPGRSAEGRTLATIDLPAAAELVGAPLATGAYLLLEAETPSGTAGALAERPALDEGPHLSYAIQWIVFGVLGLIGLIVLATQEYRDRHRDEEPARQPRARRRSPSDAEIEDALLDG